MPEMYDLVAVADPRLELVRAEPTAANPRCVLLWVQRAKRATANPAVNVAVSIADRLRVPEVAEFLLVPVYPRATLRSYHFIAEELRDRHAAFAERGIGWRKRVGEPAALVPALAEEIGAAAVVTDQGPLRLRRGWRRAVGERLRVPLVAVDTDSVAPPSLFSKEECAAFALCRKLWLEIERGDLLAAIPDPARGGAGGPRR